MFTTTVKTWTQSDYLSVMTGAPAEAIKALGELALNELGDDIDVLQSRTGLVMIPYTDSTQGTRFLLGEALIAEAHIRIANGIEGYGMCLGRDVQQAMAIAVLDAALQANIMREAILTWVKEQAAAQTAADDTLLRQVEATRVEMETF